MTLCPFWGVRAQSRPLSITPAAGYLPLPLRLPQSQTEWAQLLESQQKYHDTELQKWREIIKSSVMLLDQVRCPQSVIFRKLSPFFFSVEKCHHIMTAPSFL